MPDSPLPQAVAQDEPELPDSQPPASVEPPAPAGELPGDADAWIHLYAQLPLSGMLKSICGQLAFRAKQGDTLVFDIDPAASGVLSDKYQAKFQQLLSSHLGLSCTIRIEAGEQQNESPAARAARERREALQAAEQEILESPLAKALETEFSARVVPGSVELVGATEGQDE